MKILKDITDKNKLNFLKAYELSLGNVLKACEMCNKMSRNTFYEWYKSDEDEVAVFKKRLDKYTKVLHTKDGRIYEQKNNSLMQKLDYEE